MRSVYSNRLGIKFHGKTLPCLTVTGRRFPGQTPTSRAGVALSDRHGKAFPRSDSNIKGQACPSRNGRNSQKIPSQSTKRPKGQRVWGSRFDTSPEEVNHHKKWGINNNSTSSGNL
jgi:hypothetical protein